MARSDTQFKNGHEGIGGRPKDIFKLREQARDKGESVVKFWAKIMNDPNEKTQDRLRASENLWEAGCGKNPILDVNLEPQNTEPKPVVIEHVGMTQEQVDKAYPHEAKARKERLANEAKQS